MYVVVEFMFKGTIYVSAAPKKWVNGSVYGQEKTKKLKPSRNAKTLVKTGIKLRMSKYWVNIVSDTIKF